LAARPLTCENRRGGRNNAFGSAFSLHDCTGHNARKHAMIGTILLIVLILLLLGAIPSWPYSRGWGYFPSGALGIVLVVVLILVLTGNI
jgi:hypothetical protein